MAQSKTFGLLLDSKLVMLPCKRMMPALTAGFSAGFPQRVFIVALFAGLKFLRRKTVLFTPVQRRPRRLGIGHA